MTKPILLALCLMMVGCCGEDKVIRHAEFPPNVAVDSVKFTDLITSEYQVGLDTVGWEMDTAYTITPYDSLLAWGDTCDGEYADFGVAPYSCWMCRSIDSIYWRPITKPIMKHKILVELTEDEHERLMELLHPKVSKLTDPLWWIENPETLVMPDSTLDFSMPYIDSAVPYEMLDSNDWDSQGLSDTSIFDTLDRTQYRIYDGGKR